MENSHSNQYPPNVRAILNILQEKTIPYELRVFDAPARQASQAAALVGCPLGAIVKSLIFQKTKTNELMMVLVSGNNRADLSKLSNLVGVHVQPAQPDVVLAETGYPVGAVPPCGLHGIVRTIIDADLMHFEHLWASAGIDNMVFQINPIDLITLVNGQVEEIKRS